jgi:DNA-binding transcriptional ArsR family regulator
LGVIRALASLPPRQLAHTTDGYIDRGTTHLCLFRLIDDQIDVDQDDCRSVCPNSAAGRSDDDRFVSGEAFAPVPEWLNAVADPVRLRIICFLVGVPDATASELVALASASRQTVRRHLDALVAFGVVHQTAGVPHDTTLGRPPARFSLPLAVRRSVGRLLGVDVAD